MKLPFPLRARAFPPLILGLCFCTPVSPACADLGQAKIPRHRYTNIIFISIDTLRRDHLGCYGYERNTSPNIDLLADRSVLFENFIAQAVLTPVSQMSIFSSRYPRANGLVSFQVPKDAITTVNLPNILKVYGYTNAAFLSSPEFIQRGSSKIKGNYKNSFDDLFDDFVPANKPWRKTPVEALDWINKNKGKKFFLWLAVGTVHFPFTHAVPPPYKTMYDPPGYTPFFCGPCGIEDEKCGDEIGYGVLSRIYKGNFYVDSKPLHRLSKEDIDYIVGRYDAGIHYTDLFVGEVIELIKKLGLDEKTLVVLHSTHGEDLGEHGYFMHYDLYDTEVKNALLLKFPEGGATPQRIAAQVQGIDIMPTILSYLDIPINHESQGKSLLPLIETGDESGLSEYAYMNRLPLWEYLVNRRNVHFKSRGGCTDTTGEQEALEAYSWFLSEAFADFTPADPPYYPAIRTNEWKLILRNNKEVLEKTSWWSFVSGSSVEVREVELYDLKNDPHEVDNVAGKHPDVVQRLKKQLLEWDAAMQSLAKKGVGYDEKTTILPYPGVMDP
ncbi:MAG: sulfatase [Deferrisomatales bacterium]|nr:sulfatase [Deferrisomatales bacterium]